MVTKADAAVAENRERLRVMEEHLKNVRQEVGHTDALMAAKKREISTEEHLCALAAREAGRYTHDHERVLGTSSGSPLPTTAPSGRASPPVPYLHA